MTQCVFLISDGTGITVSSMAQSLLSQFESIEFTVVNLPYVNTLERAYEVEKKIKASAAMENTLPIAITTIMNDDILNVIANAPCVRFDFIQTFLKPMEKTLGVNSSHSIGKAHGMSDYEHYKRRMDAVNYSLSADDGAAVHHYRYADLILVGVSRSGKTPTSLFLALNNGLSVANYPITEEDLQEDALPEPLKAYKDKLFGLTISVERLMAIREERRPHSQYASKLQCLREIRAVERLYKHEKIQYLDSTYLSVEELATKIMARMRLKNYRLSK